MRRRSRTGLWAILLLFITALVFSTAWLYTTWQSSQTVLPPGLMINGLPLGGRTRDQALSAVEQAYTVPISVTYAGEPIAPILPEIIELRVDMPATAENLDEAVATESDAEAFLAYLQHRLQRQAPEAIEVSAVVLYSRERVDAFLERTAQKHDHAPMQTVALPESDTFRPAAPGTELDIEASVPLLIDAILAADPTRRHVDLVVETEPTPAADINILSAAISARLADFTGIAGIFAKELSRGQELCINCDVAYTGTSAMRIGIATEVYRNHDIALPGETASLMRDMLAETNNAAADQLLASVSATGPYSGAQQVTELLSSLGLESTFMAAPLGDRGGTAPPNVVTSANARTDLTTEPDPYVQTTALEAGILLENLHQCSKGGGSLRALYPQALTPAECEEILGWMEQNETTTPLGEGMPPGTRIAHEHAWDGNAHADISLVYGPQSNFILVVFLYQPTWLAWEDGAPTFAEIGELTYRFFNG